MVIDNPSEGPERRKADSDRPRINGVIFSQRLIDALERGDIGETSRRLEEIERIIEAKREILDFGQCNELRAVAAKTYHSLISLGRDGEAHRLEELFSAYFKIQ